MILLGKSDWDFLFFVSDPGSSRIAGGINPLNAGPQNAYSLRIPMSGWAAGAPIFGMAPKAPIIALATVGQSIQGWLAARQFGFGNNGYCLMRTRVGSPVSYAITVILSNPDSLVVKLDRFAGGPPVTIISTVPLFFSLGGVLGMRLRANDDPGGVRLQASYNLNGSGWVDLYNSVDSAGAPSVGIPGSWGLLFGTQSGIPVGLAHLLLDDIEMGNDLPV
jgi:hypothetical protein